MSTRGTSVDPADSDAATTRNQAAAGRVLRFAGFQRCVSDLERSVNFYCDGLGFLRDATADTLSRVDHAVRSARLILGDEWIDLREYPDAAVAGNAPVSSAAFQHIAVVTHDIDAAIRRLRRCGPLSISADGPVRLPANTGGVTAWKFRDPDGHPIELIQFPEGVGDPKWQRAPRQSLTLGIDHSAIGVVDVERSLSFYCGMLGLDCTMRQVNRGAEQALLDGVPESVVEVVGLAPARYATPHLELLGYRLPDPQSCPRSESVVADGADCMVFVVSRLDDTGWHSDSTGMGCPAAMVDCSADNPRSTRLRDPDGHLLELVEAPHGTPRERADDVKQLSLDLSATARVPMPVEESNVERELERLQRAAFRYFEHETNPQNGLVLDKTAPLWPASIAATGLALACYPVAIERGFMTRDLAIERTLATLRFFRDSPQGPEPNATGHHGFYYHFLDMQTGRRAWQSELSTVDSGFLFAGMLAAAGYFTGDTSDECEIRDLANALYECADWVWAHAGGDALGHGWKPETGFLPYHWQGYNEALLLYVLALGSPTHPLPADAYSAWCSTYEWKSFYGIEYLYAGPLFIHQLSHVWIDFRGIQDEYMRGKGIDYFENSRRATQAQQRYAMDNPLGLTGYGEHCWGITASDGPGPATAIVDGAERTFYDYVGRGAPEGIDDGSIAPWAVIASLPFAPEIVYPTIEHFVHHLKLHDQNPYGFKATFNRTLDNAGEKTKPDGSWTFDGWVSPWHFGLNVGPIVLMTENYRSGMLWKLMRGCRPVVTGLRRAGFEGGWLGPASRNDPHKPRCAAESP